MPEVVNQYSQTFIGQSVGTEWAFAMPMIPKLSEKNYFEIDVTQMAIERTGASAPHTLFFFVANIPGTKSAIINSTGQIDNRTNLGMISNYDSGANIAQLTASAPVSFRLNTMQPGTPFHVTMCKLQGQQIAQVPGGANPPNQLVPASSPDVGASFLATIDNGAGLAGTTLTVTSVNAGIIIINSVLTYNGIPRTITAFVTGTGGVGTYTVSGGAELLTPAVQMITSLADDVSPCQFIMTWNVREMSPYEVRRNQMIQY